MAEELNDLPTLGNIQRLIAEVELKELSPENKLKEKATVGQHKSRHCDHDHYDHHYLPHSPRPVFTSTASPITATCAQSNNHTIPS